MRSELSEHGGKMEKLKDIKLFLLDMDGTIYLDEELFDGTADFLRYVKDIGGRYIFMTNNSSKSVDKYIEKLGRMGISATADDFLTSVNATVPVLLEKKYKKVYTFGTESFIEQLRAAGVPAVTELFDDIDCLCMGFDTELSFKKLEDACILLNRGVDYIATNPDLVCPTWYGSVPDCGSVSYILNTATGRMPRFIGKPQPEMAYLAMQKTGFSPDKTAVIGDRIYTDIACGVNAGIHTIFVLSGEGTLEDVTAAEKKPEYIFGNIRELYRFLTGQSNISDIRIKTEND